MIKYDVLQGTSGPSGVSFPVPCTSAEHPSITCSFVPAPISTVEQIVTERDILLVTGLTRDILSNQSFIFRTNDKVFRNPPTTKEITTFMARTQRADSKTIDEQTTGIKYQVSTPVTILSNLVQIRAPTGEIN